MKKVIMIYIISLFSFCCAGCNNNSNHHPEWSKTYSFCENSLNKIKDMSDQLNFTPALTSTVNDLNIQYSYLDLIIRKFYESVLLDHMGDEIEEEKDCPGVEIVKEPEGCNPRIPGDCVYVKITNTGCPSRYEYKGEFEYKVERGKNRAYAFYMAERVSTAIISQTYFEGTFDLATGEIIDFELSNFFLDDDLDNNQQYIDDTFALEIHKESNGNYKINWIGCHMSGCSSDWGMEDVSKCEHAFCGKINLFISDMDECAATINGSGEEGMLDMFDGSVESAFDYNISFKDLRIDMCNCGDLEIGPFHEQLEPADGKIIISDNDETLIFDFTDKICTDGCPGKITYNGENITDSMCR